MCLAKSDHKLNSFEFILTIKTQQVSNTKLRTVFTAKQHLESNENTM